MNNSEDRHDDADVWMRWLESRSFQQAVFPGMAFEVACLVSKNRYYYLSNPIGKGGEEYYDTFAENTLDILTEMQLVCDAMLKAVKEDQVYKLAALLAEYKEEVISYHACITVAGLRLDLEKLRESLDSQLSKADANLHEMQSLVDDGSEPSPQ